MTEYKNIMIYGEIADGHISAITKELLGGAKQIADQLGQETTAVFIGNGIGQVAQEAIAFGAQRVYIVDHPDLAQFESDRYLIPLEEIVRKENPGVFLLGHTDRGADMAPRLAFRFEVALATDCIEISIDKEQGRVILTKPVFGGLAMATLSSEDSFCMATVRPKSLTPLECDDSRQGSVTAIDFKPDPAAARVTVLNSVTEKREGIQLEDAEIIVCGGRGMGGAEGFKHLEEVAQFLKGAVGATRVACDNEWVPTTMQIGITGKIVAPDVYIAVGVSGASQHMTGCARSKTIVAINKDPSAPIFRQAHYGVVGDWKQVLPKFMDKLNALG
jgi:electron transfer flavoprotein alpha subunit